MILSYQGHGVVSVSNEGLYLSISSLDSRGAGAIQWSLSGTRRSCGGLQCQMRGYKDSRSAIQWPLSGNIRTWGGL